MSLCVKGLNIGIILSNALLEEEPSIIMNVQDISTHMLYREQILIREQRLYFRKRKDPQCVFCEKFEADSDEYIYTGRNEL